MKVSLSHTSNIKIVCLMVVGLMVGMYSAAAVYAADDDLGHRPSVDRVTIEKKRVDAVITNVGNSYAVNEETIILKADGQQVAIRKLMVPCEAEVTYDIEQGKRKAKRIAVQRTGNNRKWQWGAKTPE